MATCERKPCWPCGTSCPTGKQSRSFELLKLTLNIFELMSSETRLQRTLRNSCALEASPKNVRYPKDRPNKLQRQEMHSFSRSYISHESTKTGQQAIGQCGTPPKSNDGPRQDETATQNCLNLNTLQDQRSVPAPCSNSIQLTMPEQ